MRVMMSWMVVSLVLMGGCQLHWVSPVRATLDATAGDTVTLPGEIVDGWVIVEASVDGHEPMRFVLDTGAPGCIVTQAGADALGIEAHDIAKMTDINGLSDEYAYQFVDLVQVGPLEMRDMLFLITDNISDFFDEIGVEGLIGYPGFDEFTLDLDYPAGKVRLSTIPLSMGEGGVTELRSEHRGTPQVRISLLDGDGRSVEDQWFGVDSGGAFEMHLPESMRDWAANDLGMFFKSNWGLAGKASNLKTAPLKNSILLGETTVDRVTSEINAQDALIGHDLLRQFRVRLDPRSGLAAFTPADPDTERITALQHRGIGVNLRLVDDGEIVLLSIRADSPAAQAGLLPNDRVVAIDGVAVGDEGFVDRTAWGFEWDDPVNLTVRRKEERFEVTVPMTDMFPADLDALRHGPPDLEPTPVRLIRNADGTYSMEELAPEGDGTDDHEE